MKAQSMIKAIGIVVLIVILVRVDLGVVLQQLQDCHLPELALAVLLIFPQIALRAFRWQDLLTRQGVYCPWPRTLTFYFAAVFAGLVTPGRLGELAKGLFLKHQGLATIGYSLPSVLVDRYLDLSVLTVIALLAIPHLVSLPYAGPAAALGVTLLLVLNLAVLKWLVSSDRLLSLARRLRERAGENWSGTLEDFARGGRLLLSTRLIVPLGLTLMSYGIYFLQTYLIARAIDLPLGYTTIAMVVSVGILIGYVPITVAGLGTREAVFIFLFGRLGIPAESTLSFAFFYNLVYIACVGAISACFWMRLPDRHALGSRRSKPSIPSRS